MLAYLAVFLVFAFSLVGWMAYNTSKLIQDQIVETVDSELRNLADIYRNGGTRRLIAAIDQRSRQPGSSVYLVTNLAGESIVGNIANIQPGTLDREGWRETSYTHSIDDANEERHLALVRVVQLPGPFRLLVGRSLDERDRVRKVMLRGVRLSLFIAFTLGIIGATFVTRRVLRRVDAMTATATRIMAGDLSGRLPVAGTGDELDRLAESVNAMLARIEALMSGLKEVSDNIAHDLKTPLTRLRNRADEALRLAKGDEDHKQALEKIIDESDGLIRIFNAILLIARVESGSQTITLEETDLKPMVEALGELYEPLADENNIVLQAQAPDSVFVRCHRDLLSQAMANLLDNALNHGRLPDQKGEVTLSLAREGQEAVLTIADRGPGIAVQDRGRVFNRFVRLESSRTRPGSGLGLSLAAAILQLHGGSITLADNQPGLRAILRLPLTGKAPDHRSQSRPGE